MEHIQELKALLNVPKNIVITTHRNPDGDAIGSCLALYHLLNQYGHTVRIVSPSEYPDIFAWMPEIEKIVIFDIDQQESTELLKRADILFCLDFNSLDRIDKLGETIAELDKKTVLIDHHLYPELQADFVLSEPSASSTCELVYDFIGLLDARQKLNITIGEAILTGILTDTGSFKYSTSARLYRIVADLLELGVDDYELQDRIFNSLHVKHLRLLGHCLNNRMEILPEYEAGIITLTRKDYEVFDIQRGDTEGIVNYLLKIKNVKIAAFITEQPTVVKISLRSKGDISVQEIARKYFKGGGHRNAAGGFSYKGLRTTVQTFKDALPEFMTHQAQ